MPRMEKPQSSYIALITSALKSSKHGRLTLLEITDYLKTHFAFFRDPLYTGWKNSLRHNLSLNKCFVKILRDPRRPFAKNNYWILNEKNTMYTKAAGDYRRRRKRAQKISYFLDHIHNQRVYENIPTQNATLQRDNSFAIPVETNKLKSVNSLSPITSRKFSSSFTIDNLLADPPVKYSPATVKVPMYGVLDYYNCR